MVAGRKVGTAVARNRAKRRMREAAALSRLREDTVYVLVAEHNLLHAKFTQVTGWVNAAADAAEERL